MATSAGYGFGRYGYNLYGGPPITNLPVGYYLSLITSEYQSSPNYLAWLLQNLYKLNDVTQVLAGFIIAFDLDYAVGVQLDTVGQYIGASRTVGFQPSNNVSPVLDDATYRLLLKAKIASNYWSGTIDGLQGVWQQLFPGGQIVIIDNQNMTATITLSGTFSSIVVDLINNGYIVPRPEGVLYDYSFAELPIFGVDLGNAYIAGVDRGHAA
jgi:uncharacterized protein DUF2612